MNVNISNAALLILEGVLILLSIPLLEVVLLIKVVDFLHSSSLLYSLALSSSIKVDLVMLRPRRPDLATLQPLKSTTLRPRLGHD